MTYTTKTFTFTYRVLSYTYSITYSSDFVIIIPDKRTTSVISWHQWHNPGCTGHPACRPIRSFTVFTTFTVTLQSLQCCASWHPPHGRPWWLRFTDGRYLITVAVYI